MKPAFNAVSRRQFLLGTGGLALPLPLLPSLFPGSAQAQLADEASKRFLVHTTTYHAVFAEQFFGPLLNATPTERIANHGGFEVRKAALTSTAQGNGTVISPILQTRNAPLSPRLLGLMNVINGLDMTAFSGHNSGGALGGGGTAPSIDQVLAASKRLFPSASGVPAIVRHRVSLSRVNNGIQTTTPTTAANVKLFDLLFGTNSSAPSQPLIVDAVRSHLNAVRTNPRLSAECRTLMDSHVEMMFQAETAVRGQAGSATRPTVNTDAIIREPGFVNNPTRQADVERLFNDVVVAAFASGMSRIYVWGPDDEYTFSPVARGPFHEQIAHQLTGNASTQATFSSAAQVQFEAGMVDMANKLDAVRTADGKTLLDKALIAWGWEMGSAGVPGYHHGRGIPVVTLGNAGGYFKTGMSLDYRNLGSFLFSVNDAARWYSGLTYNQWMGMVLRSMGMTPAEYGSAASRGAFGYPDVRQGDGQIYPDAVWSVAGGDLPFLRA